VDDKEGTADCYGCIGSAYTKQHNYSEAIKNDLLSLQMLQEIGSKNGIATLYSILGTLYADEKNYGDALKNYSFALSIRKEIGDKEGIAQSYENFGNLYIQQKHFAAAITVLENAKVMADSIGEKNILKDTYKLLSEANYGAGNFKAAYEFHEKYTNLKDTILNDKNQKQIAEMSTKYQSEKKDKEIQLLNKNKDLTAVEIQKQKAERNAFIVGFILMIVLAFFIFRSYREKQKANEIITAQKIEVEHQKTIVEEKNKDITDSIYYARRIQRALLISEQYLKKQLPDYFILYQPKDIVSGDFYWALNIQNTFLIATADCTGHGVPGAFMSMLGINFLNEIVVEKNILEPNKIMDELRQNIIHALNPEDTQEEAKDGMDMVLCAFDFKNKKLKLAAANNPVWIVRNTTNEMPFLEEIKPDKFPIGKHDQDQIPFTAHEISLQKGDVVYTFTDGYADQFGGSKGKKFKYKQLKELVLANFSKPMNEQQKIIAETLVNWKGNLEQVDDILLIGIKV
ncbi:MAG: SpoIIE family protein phosphatase, partial [Bacteroidia bacterium]